MKYVMSDIHGEYNKFMEMIDKIELKPEDHLYILGDVFDRGPSPIKIIDYIVNKKNITMLKGNHEEMFIDHIDSQSTQLWFMNGGSSTFYELADRDSLYEDVLYRYVKNLPLIKVVDKFILVHAHLYLPENHNDVDIEEIINMQEEDICLWSRASVGEERQYKDYTIILGHTPVQFITKNEHEPATVLKANGTMYIDCGCHFKNYGGRLACVRLDDLKEFYV